MEIKYVPVAVEEEEPEEQTIFEVVEQMPEFPNGGMAGLMQYLSKNIKYPEAAYEERYTRTGYRANLLWRRMEVLPM